MAGEFYECRWFWFMLVTFINQCMRSLPNLPFPPIHTIHFIVGIQKQLTHNGFPILIFLLYRLCHMALCFNDIILILVPSHWRHLCNHSSLQGRQNSKGPERRTCFLWCNCEGQLWSRSLHPGGLQHLRWAARRRRGEPCRRTLPLSPFGACVPVLTPRHTYPG